MRFNEIQQTDPTGAVTIRRSRGDGSDQVALASLAERDSGNLPNGDVLVAEVEGTILAAVSLDDGAVLADPFSRTRELRNLLELRRAQLRHRTRSRRVRTLFLRDRGRPRAALAGSPPGAGGRLLQIGPRT